MAHQVQTSLQALQGTLVWGKRAATMISTVRSPWAAILNGFGAHRTELSPGQQIIQLKVASYLNAPYLGPLQLT